MGAERRKNSEERNRRVSRDSNSASVVRGSNTGTSAFHIALRAAGIGPGDEVITPSFNYVRGSSGGPRSRRGRRHVATFARRTTSGHGLREGGRAMTSRTKALIPVAFRGHRV